MFLSLVRTALAAHAIEMSSNLLSRGSTAAIAPNVMWLLPW